MKDLKEKIIQTRNLHPHFFNPQKEDINDEGLLKNVDKACSLLHQYIKSKSKISIVIDPDIDGIMASTIMYKWLSDISNPKLIVHQRNKGHGVIADNIKNTDLLIIVDSSSNSDKEIKIILKNKLAKDILIIDHHIIEGNITSIKHVCMVNTHQDGDLYPNKELSGAMTVFKVLQYMEKIYKYDNKKITTNDLSDMAAISIVSDVMDVSNIENRYYYYEGLRHVHNRGILLLMRKLNLFGYKISSIDLAFKFNKAINSMLRLQNIYSIFKLLLINKDEEAEPIIDNILSLMEERDNIEKDIMNNLVELHNDDCNMIFQNNYKNQIIAGNFNGVIASKLADNNHKNIIIVNSEYNGSARAFNNYEFKKYIDNSNYANGIGHQGAFGIKIKDINNLKSYFIDHPPIFTKSSEYDFELDIKEINKNLFDDVKEAEFLTGKGYDKIKFKINNIKITDIKESSSGKVYYEIDKKNYIRLYDSTEYKINDIITIYCNLDLSDFFGKDYYSFYCFNSEKTGHEIDEEWGF